MFRPRLLGVVATLVVTVALTLGASLPASAHASKRLGTHSLASLLARDGAGFDRNGNDFDIIDNAVRAVLTAKPSSPVAVLADGRTALTAFLPTDRAFRSLTYDLTGRWYRSERAVFGALADTLGVDTIEAVLLYHVVPGATITYRQALRADGAVLTTAGGGTITVRTKRLFVKLVDQDPNDANPYVVRANLNKGNRAIAHGINRVLRPLDV